MADNVAITAGAGTTVAADEVADGTLGTVKVQYMKLMDGTLDGTSKLTVNSNGSLPMQGYQPSTTTFSAVSTTGALTSTAVNALNVATVTLRTFTGTGPSITYKLQASDDNTNWVDLQGINNTTGIVASSFTQSAALTAGTAGPSVDFTVGAYTNVRINVTAISGTTPVAAFGLGLQSMPYEASPGAIAQGTAAAGSAIAGNPVLVGGSDGTNARAIKTNTTGQTDIRPLTTADAVTASIAAAQTLATVSTVTAVTTITNAVNIGTKTTGGATTYTLISAATTNAQFIKASAGTLYGIQASNTGAAVAFLKLYNKASAPTVVTDVAVKTLIIPAGGGIVYSNNDIGAVFGTGIAIAITGLATTADTTAVALAQVVVNADYA